ncbi:transporter substrate-binding domain-containing protein [Nocardia implantans]|uniref:Transporter substrate-binding domain-containing protein n=1 Tax=Nocardia implantans TaxID=3108168 RepID=A0ABU6AUB7_9NOCA|nr:MULTISPECIES: transporter substrate-binding domain-containing protein [unclassified Nocardia]MBF6192713.1 transporter substrate-binding domain-containing protein [Nocardia beijingensis]MEA3527377.1 transporter substrate-binding domain-containing protein [Nocardia sp. CDC192]MEB3511085.1 transporter substrate-binding domain-containing protein [Nocardia sp. CDC186]
MRSLTLPGRIGAVLIAGWTVLAAVAIPAAAQAPNALRACTPGDYPPYSLRDDAGEHRGVDVDLARGFAALLGRPIEFVPVTWATLKTDFAERDCDLAVGGISDLPSRRAFADFSITYGTDGKAPITHRANGAAYSTVAEINRPGVRVIANRGGTNEDFARKHFPDAQLTLWPDNLTIFGEIEQGRADVFVTDSVEGRYRVRQHPDLQVLHPEAPFDSFGKVLLVRKDDPVLAALLDAYLTTQLATGAVDRLFDQWIGPNAPVG